ncbi:hypothetical protein [Treponema sp.]|uniref:hypothetical protein n=1 Tax=Treponema sp. TaxID=166 RepID=UPI00298D9A30|nr:hypothetical protein [Treponema sp.]MCQ2241423.1 hypothetical protein [Treponema sp.]
MNKILYSLIFFMGTAAFGQAYVSTQSHEGKVNHIQPFETASNFDSSFYSAGSDGFLVKWSSDGMGEHYQVSDLQIQKVARNPVSGDVAVYETDGISVHRVTVIDPKTFGKRFSKRFSDSIASITFSAKGNYLMVGTNAVNGCYILNARTGNVTKKISDVPGIISMAKTGASEKKAVLYSRTGALIYYNMQTHKAEKKFSTVPALQQPIIFGTGKLNNRLFAGIKDNTVYLIDAADGKTLATYPANNGLIFASEFDQGDKQGLYFTTESGRTWSLRLVNAENLKKLLTGFNVPAPLIVKNFTGLKSRDSFTCASKNAGSIMLGTQSGNIYTMTDIPESELYSLFSITENMYQKIYDIDASGNEFYFLTNNSIYKTSFDTRIMSRIGTNPSHSNLIKYNDKIVLWSRNTAKTVQMLSLDGSENMESLFNPSNQIRALRIANNKIIYVSGTNSVCIYNLDNGTNNEVYTGTSIQDAVLIDENTLYVAKTGTGRGDSPLINVNLQTGETVPLKFNGDVAFSLSYDFSTENSNVYGIGINSNNGVKTEVFSYNPKTNVQTSLFSLSAEDSTAFTSIKLPLIFTNIGKNTVRACNTGTRKTTVYKRSASMPIKAASAGTKVAVLNRNGSISWYNSGSQVLIADWVLTTDGEWFDLVN